MNRSINLSNRFIVLAILFLSMFFFYGIDKYAIFSIDDWPYSWVSEEKGSNYFSPLGEDAVRKHVDSVKDAVVSQSREYFRSNGRFMTHVVVQTICGTIPMDTFIVINTFVFGLFLVCMFYFSLRRPFCLNDMIILLAGVWFLIPFKGMTFFGNVAMTVNYLWTTTSTLLFLILYFWLKNRGKKISVLTAIGLFFLSLIIGSLQESFCIGFAGAFFFMLILEWKKKSLTRVDLAIALGYMLGAAFCVLSPANFSRAEGNGIGFHLNVLFGLLASPAFDVFILTLVVFLMKCRSRVIAFFNENLIFSLAFLFNLLFAVVIAYNGRHQLTCISVLALILTCKIWFKEFSWKPIMKTLLSCCLLCALVVTYIPIRTLRMDYKKAYEQLLSKAMVSRDGVIGAEEFAKLTRKIHDMPLVDNYYVSTFSFFGSDCWEKCVSLMLTEGQDLYRLKQVLPDDPEVIATGCTAQNEVLPGVWNVGGIYVCRAEIELPLEAFHLKVVRRPKAFFMKDEETSIAPTEFFSHDGRWYYLFWGEIIEAKSLDVKTL